MMDILTLAIARAYTDKQKSWSTQTLKNQVFLEEGLYGEFTEYSGVSNRCVISFDGVDNSFYNALRDLREQDPNPMVVVEWDGVRYKCQVPKSGNISLGNLSYRASSMPDTGEPFLIMTNSTSITLFSNDLSKSTHTISVYTEMGFITPVDKDYIPIMGSFYMTDANGWYYKVTVEDGVLKVTSMGD